MNDRRADFGQMMYKSAGVSSFCDLLCRLEILQVFYSSVTIGKDEEGRKLCQEKRIIE